MKASTKLMLIDGQGNLVGIVKLQLNSSSAMKESLVFQSLDMEYLTSHLAQPDFTKRALKEISLVMLRGGNFKV